VFDRAGLVGLDGATHQGAFDLSYLRCIPNLVIMAPSDEDLAWKMLNTGYEINGPAAVRYPRGVGLGKEYERTEQIISIGQSKTIIESERNDVAILSFGSLLQSALQAGEELGAKVVDMRFIKPLDHKIIEEVSSRFKLIVTLEDNVIAGGAGSAVNEKLNELNSKSSVLNLGLPDEFVEHGDQEQQKTLTGLDAAGVINSIKEKFKNI
jgi:1-deoxy-D-xylulose-5-phosphate synthase